MESCLTLLQHTLLTLYDKGVVLLQSQSLSLKQDFGFSALTQALMSSGLSHALARDGTRFAWHSFSGLGRP